MICLRGVARLFGLVVSFVALILHLVVCFHPNLSLLDITSITVNDVDRPSVSCGIRGSCAKAFLDATSICTSRYDLSSLNLTTEYRPDEFVTKPAKIFSILLLFSAIHLFVYLLFYSLFAFCYRAGHQTIQNSRNLLVKLFSTWITVLALFMILMVDFFILAWFSKTAESFNYIVADQLSHANLKATAVTNGLLTLATGCILFFVAIIFAMTPYPIPDNYTEWMFISKTLKSRFVVDLITRKPLKIRLSKVWTADRDLSDGELEKILQEQLSKQPDSPRIPLTRVVLANPLPA